MLYRFSREGERHPLLPTQPGGRIAAPVSMACGKRLVLVREDATREPDVYVADLSEPEAGLRQRSRFNPELEEAALGEAEIVRWGSDEGVEVEGILIKPVGYQEGRRYPLVVQVHGGPTDHWSNQFAATRHDWAQSWLVAATPC